MLLQEFMDTYSMFNSATCISSLLYCSMYRSSEVKKFKPFLQHLCSSSFHLELTPASHLTANMGTEDHGTPFSARGQARMNTSHVHATALIFWQPFPTEWRGTSASRWRTASEKQFFCLVCWLFSDYLYNVQHRGKRHRHCTHYSYLVISFNTGNKFKFIHNIKWVEFT